MHLTYLDPHPIPDTRPATLQILHTVDALGSAGVKVDLVTPLPSNGLTPADLLGRALSPNVTLKYVADFRNRWWFPSSSNKPFYWLAKRFLSNAATDALLVRNLKFAERLLKVRGLPPLFFETHEIFAQSYRENHPHPSRRERRKIAALEAIESDVYRHSAGIIAITQCLVEDIRDHYNVHTPATVAPDGVDLHLAQAAEIRVSKGTPTLLYLGSLHPWKGVDILIHAMKHVSGAVLNVVGGTEHRIAELKHLAQREHVTEKVVFLGSVPPIRRFDIIAGSDICLLPLTQTSIGSRYTSPLKLFEYMSMAKPIVTADLPSIREVLTHGQNAMLAEAGNPDSFARAINALLQDERLRNKLGTEAEKLAENYSWEARAHTILDFIRSRSRGRA